jgi:hypothetical protein
MNILQFLQKDKFYPLSYFKGEKILDYGGCLKSPPPPPDGTVGVLLLREEEKVIILYINTFPSFQRRGVMPEGS